MKWCASEAGRTNARRRRPLRAVPVLALGFVAHLAFAAEIGAELARARELVQGGQYGPAYELLSPFEVTAAGDAVFDYLYGRAALGTQHADKAVALLERSLALKPENIPARLALGRAYTALGRYAEAKIEFETVLRFDNLPPDLLTQVEAYDEAARQSLEEGSRLTHFAYVETGLGYFRINDTVATSSGERSESFVNFRTGGGFNYQLDNGYSIDGNLDWRFRSYDDSDSRNEGDVRWNLAGSHAVGDDGNLAIGLRGRNSYRGNGDYRNDAGIYADYRQRMDADNQLTFGAEVLRREYPQGGLRDLSRSSASVSAGWVHSLFEGKGSFSVTGHAGQHFGTNRPDGNSDFYGATVSFDYTVNKIVGWGSFVWWEHDAYNIDRIHFHPDTLDNTVLLSRNDNLYEVGAYLVWEFVPTWTLRPELLFIRDQSNSFKVNYGSTEVWLNVRKAF